MKPGDLVWVEGYNMPSIFVSWCTDEDPQAEYGVANLLINGEVRQEHNDWWVPWKPTKNALNSCKPDQRVV